mmetsp:Transcript_49717/g.155587  ORF Transcript_49717/g.155587 Transcript_49717/m.155587 type:complete len:143 (+) Transcript_49717:805-1233(+)
MVYLAGGEEDEREEEAMFSLKSLKDSGGDITYRWLGPWVETLQGKLSISVEKVFDALRNKKTQFLAMPNCFELFAFTFALTSDEANGPQPWLLKVESSMEAENALRGQEKLVGSAVQLSLHALGLLPRSSEPPTFSLVKKFA